MLGQDESGAPVIIDLVSPWGIAVAGQSRSGKSQLVYRLLATAANYDEVAVVGCDPTGLIFQPFADALHPDWRASRLSDVGPHVEVLDRLVEELDRRIDYLLASDLDQFEDFSVEFPLLVAVLEEYPALISTSEADDLADARRPGERYAPRVRRNVRRIIQEGAKVGFRVVLLSQRADAAIIGGSERSNLAFRISLRTVDADGVRMLHPLATAQMIIRLSLAAPGVGIVDGPGEVTRFFRGTYMTYAQYLHDVRKNIRMSASHE
ncbi:hypothetical protein KPL76_01905 [Subtercola sp. PAMC28395]|uniref:FtsK/SpoIIIE domain-containing protein n=1 Tax=Subtercola sp. PAMC28395 TaxID=2846775 RepID=UPI001C0D2B0F|nr:FtsK/SpoIIIE domain-containing protein [Subtercola sp. PAMC28395]QWT24206.1 hypothetical protein KPL76_01905 [Subtercola sp. PAMC28395]